MDDLSMHHLSCVLYLQSREPAKVTRCCNVKSVWFGKLQSSCFDVENNGCAYSKI